MNDCLKAYSATKATTYNISDKYYDSGVDRMVRQFIVFAYLRLNDVWIASSLDSKEYSKILRGFVKRFVDTKNYPLKYSIELFIRI